PVTDQVERHGVSGQQQEAEHSAELFRAEPVGTVAHRHELGGQVVAGVVFLVGDQIGEEGPDALPRLRHARVLVRAWLDRTPYPSVELLAAARRYAHQVPDDRAAHWVP